MATLPPHLHQLFGACACDRNQYTITVPVAEVRRARVFFDNSTANRRAQAAPVTAWLRVPRAWYASCTVAQFEGESHALIRRTFYPPPPAASDSAPLMSRTRRHFCGFCGTHLSKAEEFEREPVDGDIDVTLGSLEGESLSGLESLGVLSSEEEEEDRENGEEEQERENSQTTEAFERRQRAAAQDAATTTATADAADGFIKQDAMINDEHHISAMPGLGGPGALAVSQSPLHQMQHRGIPYFETLVENSRLGQIKRRKGGHISRDGSVRVQWEVVELTNEPAIVEEAASAPVDDNPHKRQRRVT